MKSISSRLAGALVVLVAIFFFVMGISALIDPQATLRLLSPGELGLDMRNEARAVYGGFGIAIGTILLATLKNRAIAKGARLTVAAALAGMASGRIVSLLIEAPASSIPVIFMVLEFTFAAMLVLSLRSED